LSFAAKSAWCFNKIPEKRYYSAKIHFYGFFLGSFVLRKETHDEDQSKSDMDVDSENDLPEKQIEVNVKIPIVMQPRTIRRPTPNKMIGPKRVNAIGKFTTQSALKTQQSGSPEQQPKITKKEKINEPIGIRITPFTSSSFQ